MSPKPSPLADSTLCLPLKLDAFVLNSALCSPPSNSSTTPLSKIAPITQPNYTFLRPTSHILQNDILPHHDLHNATPAARNPRLTNLLDGTELRHRQGVYLHWSLPRVYRSGNAATEERNGGKEAESPTVSSDNGNTKVNDKDEGEGEEEDKGQGEGQTDPDHSAPKFKPVPTRWLVIRRIHPGTAKPPLEATKGYIGEVTSWVVESDRLLNINTIPSTADLQTDVSPYTNPADVEKGTIQRQAEVFIGQKVLGEDWRGEEKGVPRVPLSLLTSGNMLFADYQPHNSNVFSIVDSFRYRNPEWVKLGGSVEGQPLTDDEGKAVQEWLYLDEAKASYYVIGWHPSPEEDPFSGTEINRTTRLAESFLKLKLNQTTDPISKDWVGEGDGKSPGSQVLCHGAMYEVMWNVKKRPDKVPADEASRKLHEHVPISVGTTAIDSLLAYVHGYMTQHQGSGDGKDGEMEALFKAIVKLQTLLIQRDDTVDAQRQAMDLMYNYNYRSEPGGTRWYLGGTENPGKPAKPPTEDDVARLAELNAVQVHLDQLDRWITTSRWEMFSEWWKYVSDVRNAEGAHRFESKDKVNAMMQRKRALEETRELLVGQRDGLKAGLQLAKMEVQKPFYKQLDPTVMVAGMVSGWPEDFMELLEVRLGQQVVGWADVDTTHGGVDWKCLVQARQDGKKGVLEKLPEKLKKPARALVAEFFTLMPDENGAVAFRESDLKQGTALPQFHDQAGVQVPREHIKPEDPFRDRWNNTQPWFPLFIEWEVEYVHIPFTEWELAERHTETETRLNKLCYALKDEKNPLPNRTGISLTDRRTCSGRVLLLPQPSFSLQSKVDEIIQSTPKSLLPLTDADILTLRTKVRNLNFLSAPLAGLTDHLTTRFHGTHLKPTIRTGGKALKPLADAVDTEAGWQVQQFTWMGTETSLTPYATSVPPHGDHSLFKPCTHGQFRITKLNIIDKFGQAIHATEQKLSLDPPDPVYPYISEFYAPLPVEVTDPRDGTKVYRPNIVAIHPTEPLSEFIQLPVHINQPARLNACFVKRDHTDGTTWLPQSEWENPIWGWLVLNYAQHGLQIFLPDGTFYREIRLGGDAGASVGEKWLPFAPPAAGTGDLKNAQIDALVTKLSDASNLQEFVDMINGALGKSTPAPEAYAQFLNSIVGKPLALVNIGISLELAEPELRSESTLEAQTLDQEHQARRRYLLQNAIGGNTAGFLPRYEFAVRIGDAERSFDGLVGYFDVLGARDEKGNDIDFGKLHTFFTNTPPESNDPIPSPTSPTTPTTSTPEMKPWTHPITSRTFPRLHAFHHPILPPAIDQSTGRYIPTPTATLTQKRNEELKAFGVVMDPFTPIHAYSGILPNKELALPSWTWQEGMARMTAFFRVGPVVQARDVEAYVPAQRLRGDYKIVDGVGAGKEKEPGKPLLDHKGVTVPGISVREGWRWLQPYFIDREGQEGNVGPMPVMPKVDGGDGDGDKAKQEEAERIWEEEIGKWLDGKETAYMPLQVQPVRGVALEDGPYTAVEGFLQLQKPIVRP